MTLRIILKWFSISMCFVAISLFWISLTQYKGNTPPREVFQKSSDRVVVDMQVRTLPQVEDRLIDANFPGNEKRTFFLETSGRGTLSLRQLLAVESAARHLKDLLSLEVYIITNGSVALESSDHMKVLAIRYPCIKYVYTTAAALFQGSPMEAWYRSGKLNTSKYLVEHTSDALRLLLMYLHGGVYLDIDIIFQRWITFPNNSLTWANNNNLANGFLAFKKGHRFIKKFLETFVQEYDPNAFATNGPMLVTRLYRTHLNDVSSDVILLPTSVFLPVPWQDYAVYFDEKLAGSVLNRTKDSFGIHYFGHQATGTVSSNSTSAFASVARLNCPIVWSIVETVNWV